MKDKDGWLDDDIASLKLGEAEKSGLQVYRNYQRAFEKQAIDDFRSKLFSAELDVGPLERVLEILAKEDVRLLPLVVCSYADEALKDMFHAFLPSDVPGGTKNLTGGYGPLSDLSKRIKMAYAFDLLSQDLLSDVDTIRMLRNRLSHDWDMAAADAVLDHPSAAGIFPVESELHAVGIDQAKLDSESRFRVRLIWLIGRVHYEIHAYHIAKSERIDPSVALYEGDRNSWLDAISSLCFEATKASVR